MDKIIHRSITLNCDPKQAFDMFSKNEHLEKWLTKVAEVEPEVGGRYELFWNPEDRENDNTIGCKILAIEPNKFLSFEWKGAKQFKNFMNTVRPLTNVTVFFIPGSNENDTEVHLIHSGWRGTSDWNEARAWFEVAWTRAFSELEKYINDQK